MSKRPIAWAVPALVLLAILAAAPAFAAETEGQIPVPAVQQQAQSPAGTGCGLALELVLDDPAAAATPAAGTCPAAPPQSSEPAEPVFLGGRTCRCSCGFPCKTDADCGPGGLCRAGITCC
jgi:hypothetical protein